MVRIITAENMNQVVYHPINEKLHYFSKPSCSVIHERCHLCVRLQKDNLSFFVYPKNDVPNILLNSESSSIVALKLRGYEAWESDSYTPVRFYDVWVAPLHNALQNNVVLRRLKIPLLQLPSLVPAEILLSRFVQSHLNTRDFRDNCFKAAMKAIAFSVWDWDDGWSYPPNYNLQLPSIFDYKKKDNSQYSFPAPYTFPTPKPNSSFYEVPAKHAQFGDLLNFYSYNTISGQEMIHHAIYIGKIPGEVDSIIFTKNGASNSFYMFSRLSEVRALYERIEKTPADPTAVDPTYSKHFTEVRYYRLREGAPVYHYTYVQNALEPL